jgi:maltokinase
VTIDTAQLADYLSRARWFGGKGRAFSIERLHRLDTITGPAEGPQAVVVLVEVSYDPGGSGVREPVEHYQLPLALYPEPQSRLDHALVGRWEEPGLGEVVAYDAVHDREAMALWLQRFAAATPGRVAPATGAAFHRLGEHQLDLSTHSSLFSGEQSNSSVAFGEDALMKIFRKVMPGTNPDIRIHEVLTEAGVEHIAPLYGWLDAVIDFGTGPTTVQLAMLQKFLRTASDGWGLAESSVRTLFAEPDVHAAASGGDFAGEAGRLGEALAEVHEALRGSFPTSTRPAAELAATMTRRLEETAASVPELAPYAEGLRTLFDTVADLPDYAVQTVHGDLHLGQTLRTSLGWKLVDFEGEPAKALEERLLPDSRWRDVAGMLRSFDYAPRAFLHLAHGEIDEQAGTRADEWVNRCRNHFVVAYAGTDLAEADRLLLEAYVADKAIYECLYEARNRPTWLDIPLGAIARLTEAA